MVTNILKFVGLRLESTVEHCSVEQLNTSHYNSCTIGISQVNYTYFIQNTQKFRFVADEQIVTFLTDDRRIKFLEHTSRFHSNYNIVFAGIHLLIFENCNLLLRINFELKLCRDNNNNNKQRYRNNVIMTSAAQRKVSKPAE